MSINLDLPEKLAPELVKMVTLALEKAKLELEQCNLIVQNYQDLLDRLTNGGGVQTEIIENNGMSTSNRVELPDYMRVKADHWNDKIEYVLRAKGKCMSLMDVKNVILPYFSSAGKSLSSALSTNAGNRFRKFVGSDGKFRYGLPEWFDNQGNVKEEYAY